MEVAGERGEVDWEEVGSSLSVEDMVKKMGQRDEEQGGAKFHNFGFLPVGTC